MAYKSTDQLTEGQMDTKNDRPMYRASHRNARTHFDISLTILDDTKKWVTDQRMDGPTAQWTNGRTDRQMDGWTDGPTDRWTDGQSLL